MIEETWTRTPPTEVRDYWWQPDDDQLRPVPLSVIFKSGDTYYVAGNHGAHEEYADASLLGGWWLPLDMPENNPVWKGGA